MPAIALITSPVVSLAIAVAAIAEESWAIYIAPLISLVTIIEVLMSKRESDTEEWYQTLARWILVIFIFLLSIATIGVVFKSLGLVIFIFFVLLIGSIITYSLTSRHTTATYVISTIGSSMRQNLPLPMALESAAAGRKDNESQILQRIRDWLLQGYSLSESIKKGYPKCPSRAVAMITAAEQIDQLPLAINAIETDMNTKTNERKQINPVHPLYPVIVISFMIFILLSMMKFVIPQFKAVLDEMTGEASLPLATRLLVGIVRFIGNEYGWLIWGGFLLTVLFVIPVSIQIKFRPRRPDKPYLLSRIGDFIKWHLPILHWFERNYSMVQIAELLRLSLNSGYTINKAIDNTLGLDVNNCFRKRLKKWLNKVEQGDNIADAVRESKLGSALAWAFDGQINQGNTLAVLETIESCYRSNYSYGVNLARFIIWPCIILTMGIIVGFVVLGIFSPGIFVIRQLAEMVP